MTSYDSLQDALVLGTGVERSFRCHVGVHGHATASVNALTGLWYCYSCGARGGVDTNMIEISADSVVRACEKVDDLINGDRHEIYPEGWLSIYDANGPGDYWLKRFSPETCAKFRLGVDPKGDHVTYPLRDNAGRVLGVVKRALDPDGPKYRYPFGVDMSKLLFNISGVDGDTLVVCEGATDAMAACEVGYQGIALYGSKLSRHHKILLRRYSPRTLVVVFDNDEAGRGGARQVMDAFPDLDVRVALLRDDLASMSMKKRSETLDSLCQGRLGSDTCESSGSQQHSKRLVISTSTPGRQPMRLSAGSNSLSRS